MFGLEPITFWCIFITISVQVILLILWGIVWKEGE